MGWEPCLRCVLMHTGSFLLTHGVPRTLCVCMCVVLMSVARWKKCRQPSIPIVRG